MRIEYTNASAIPAGAWIWPHINPATEWADKMSGAIVIETDFLDRLERLRVKFGKPFVFDSCYRTPQHNQIVSAVKSDDGPHTLALACDIRVNGADALELVRLAIAEGFTGIGLSQKLGSDAEGRFVHLDCAPDRPQAPRPTVWSY